MTIPKDVIITFAPVNTLEKVERIYIQLVLDSSRTLAEAAKTLGINQSTLWRKRKQYDLSFQREEEQ
jgi:NtrC-family two-component system response regulator AlgB